MTVMDAIGTVDVFKPNSVSQEEKVKWLSQLDGMIKKNIIDTHEGGEKIIFEGYTIDDLTKELLVPAPHDCIYRTYLEAQIDFANNEYGKYNNDSLLFNEQYSEFWRYYNRTHMPIGASRKYF